MAGTSTTLRPRERNSTITVLLETVLSKCSPRTCRLERGAGSRQGSPGAQSRASFGIGTTQTLGHICVGNFYRKRLQNEPYEIFVNTMPQYVEQLFGLLNAPELVACGRAVQQAMKGRGTRHPSLSFRKTSSGTAQPAKSYLQWSSR